MSIFKRRNAEDDLYNNDIFEDDDNVLPLEDSEYITPWNDRNITARHALTKDELLNKKHSSKLDNMAPGSLFAKVAQNTKTEDFIVSNAEKEPTPEKTSPDNVVTDNESSFGYKDIANTEIEKIPVYAKVGEEKIEEVIDSDSTSKEVSSLLEKCRDFIYDDSTEKEEFLTNKDTPLYELESVEDILENIKKSVETTKNERQGKNVTYSPSSNFDDAEEDIYLKNIELERHIESNAQNVKTVHRSTNTDSASTQREVPVEINMLDRSVSDPVMIATKDDLDLGATKVLPDISKTEVSLNSADIQMSLADADIVKPVVPVTPAHALYDKKGIIKKELLDDFFEDSEEPLEKPQYSNIISDSRFADTLGGEQQADNQDDTMAFSLSSATNEFNKIEGTPIVEVNEKPLENAEPVSRIENLNAIVESLNGSINKLKLKLIPTGILAAALLIISFLFKPTVTISFVCLALLIVECIINFDVIKNIISVFSLNHGIDTPVSFGLVLTIIQTAICGFILKTDYINLTGIVSVALCFNVFGKIFTLSRVSKNAELLNNSNEKNTLKMISNKDSAETISKGFIEGDTLIASVQSAINLKRFVAQSFESGPFETLLSRISLYSLLCGLVTGIIAFIFLKDISSVINIFVLAICLCYPPAALMILNLPLNHSSSKLRKMGAVFSGFSGANLIEECNAITINATDLFPSGSIKLCKMYVLSENKVDFTFKCAASVAKNANSPLADMFADITEGATDLPVSEDINYEDKMGISGWIKDKRVLIGNRLLMEGHGIKIPESNIDKKILKSGYFPVYVAFDSRPCLLLICSYDVLDDIGYNIRCICNMGISVFVSSTDPNTTENMITDYFGLYDNSVKVISPQGMKALDSETEFAEDVESPAVIGDSINGFLKTIIICNKLHSSSLVMAIVHIFTIVLSLVGLLYFVCSGRFAELNSMTVFGSLAVSSIVTCASYLFKKP